MKKINVLSLFGGIECGRVAMDRIGWNIWNYYSSEIDEYAKKITMENYPEIKHIWDVREIWYNEGSIISWWFTLPEQIYDWFCGERVVIDVLIGGSPCQDLSGAKAGGKGLQGEKSGLFYEYVRILQETKPEYFLLENVASMKKSEMAKITEILGVEPIMINSNLVSAQNRKRLYWAGKWNGEKYETVKIEQPEDRGILLRDILEDIPYTDPLWSPIPEEYITDGKTVRIPEATVKGYTEAEPGDVVDMNHKNSKTMRGRLMRDKIHTLTANMDKGNYRYVLGLAHRNRWEGKAPECNLMEKANSLTTVQTDSEVLGVKENELVWRKLTPIECERLQTLPDNYTSSVSNSRRYRAIGNGWTVDVIAHILSYFTFDNH